jgi:uncharacterized protein (DUF1330 family)
LSAYVFVNIRVTDPERYARYIEIAPATVATFGGRYLARGGAAQKLEGSWEPQRVVVLEFESAERARQWWASPLYEEAKALRQRSAQTEMILVEGL